MNSNPYDFSKRSRRAILVFTFLLISIVLIPRFIVLFRPPTSFSYNQTVKEKELANKTVLKSKASKKYVKGSRFSIPKRKFDPNDYTVSDWMKLGLSEKQAGVMISFGKYGYYSEADLRKSFVMSDELFTLIKDSIIFPEKPLKQVEKTDQLIPKPMNIVNINTATEQDLLALKGIGQFFATNIIKRRDQLGGFTHIQQLLEVWKMDEEKLAAIKPYIIVDDSQVKKFDLNTVTAEELKSHPYISWNVANSIVKLRSQKGSFATISDIKESVLIDEALFDKIKAYIIIKK